MAEALAIAGSVIAIIQVADRVIDLCKYYLRRVKDAPSDLRSILIEVSTLKTTLKNAKFLSEAQPGASDTIKTLSSDNGPITGCHQSLVELEKLLHLDPNMPTPQRQSKRQKIQASFAELKWPFRETRARKLLEEISRFKTTITLGLITENSGDIKEIKLKTSQIQIQITGSQRWEIRRWLEHTDPSRLHRQAFENYTPGTGDWMIRTNEWATWINKECRCLWIHGIPGAGKTVLLSRLIEKLTEHCENVKPRQVANIYYYCHYSHNQDEAEAFLRWLITNLCRKANNIPNSIFEAFKHGQIPSLTELTAMLEVALDGFETVYISIDALDESIPRQDLLDVLENLATSPKFSKLQILATSREYLDIERVMSKIATEMPMDNPFVTEDIRLHVKTVLGSKPRFQRWPQDILKEVEEALVTGARGMFRWAVCQADVLQRLKYDRDIIRTELRNLPKTLFDVYDRILSMIPEEEHLFVEHVLQWITFQHHAVDSTDRQPVSDSVLVKVVEKSLSKLHDIHNNRFYDEDLLWELCGCFVSPSTVVKGFKGVSFAHYTVREYLDSKHFERHTVPSSNFVGQDIRSAFIDIVLTEALQRVPSELETLLSDPDPGSFDAIMSNQNGWSIFFALRLLVYKDDTLFAQKELSNLAINLINPSLPHFRGFIKVAKYFGMALNFHLSKDHMWAMLRIKWDTEFYNADVEILLYLLLTEMSSGRHFHIAQTYLKASDRKKLYQNQLKFWLDPTDQYYDPTHQHYVLDGTILEILAQLSTEFQHEFNFLLDHGDGLFDPSVILLYFVAAPIQRPFFRRREDISEWQELTKKLLSLGADPNMSAFRATPLQIALYSADVVVVRYLLEAGADAYATGNQNGLWWREGTVMERFNQYHDVSALSIVMENEADTFTYPTDPSNAQQKLQKLLLQYGVVKLVEVENSDGSTDTCLTMSSSTKG